MNYKGKAIYNPLGKAGEYSYWACNFYKGCTNECEYCYLKKGILSKALGGNKVELKKCFKDEGHALLIFQKELFINKKELQKNGLFFTFTSDNLLEESIGLLSYAVDECFLNDVPVKILTKTGLKQIKKFNNFCNLVELDKDKVAIGYTLTGHDELERFAAPNVERIESMLFAKENGFKTFASIEPIIDFESSRRMIELALPYCDLFKIGLESGKKYDVVEAQSFVEWLNELDKPLIYLKESLQKLTGYKNSDFDFFFVERDYNIFKK